MTDRAAAYRAVHAACQTMTYGQIENAIAEITAGLTKPQLKALAAATDIILFTGESKAKWRAAFARRVIELKASAERCSVAFGA